jgi:hypothetical protein
MYSDKPPPKFNQCLINAVGSDGRCTSITRAQVQPNNQEDMIDVEEIDLVR